MEIQQPFNLNSDEYAASVSNLDGTLTISPNTGDVLASLNLGNANTWTNTQTFNDDFNPIHISSDKDWSLTEFEVMQFGAVPLGPDVTLRLYWYNTGAGGQGALRFEDSTTNLKYINANIYAENISVSNVLQGGNIQGAIYPSGFTQYYVAYGGSGGSVTGDAKFTFNDSTNRLLISNTGITAQSQLHLHQSGATALETRYTNSATGSTASDGFQVGITTAGVAEIRQRENLNLDLYTNNTLRLSLTGGGNFVYDTNLIYGDATNDFVAIGGTTRVASGFGKFNLYGTANSTDSPVLAIKNTSDTSTGKNGGIWTETRMTSRYLRTIQNLGYYDNSFGNPGVIQWTAWEYSNNTYTTLATPTEFTGWSYQYYNGSTYTNLLRIHTSGVFVGAPLASSTPATVFQANNRTVAAGTPGTLSTVTIARAINSNVSYPQAASFNIGTYSTNSIANGYGPDTRLDLALKSTSSDTYTTDVTVMTWLDTGSVGIGETSPTARLQIKSSTSGSGSNAFRIQSAGSADRLVYRDDGRLWLGTGTVSYNGLLTLNSSSTQTEIQFTTAASGQTSTDGFYLQYTDAVGARYLLMENQPHVFYISGSEVARFSNTGAIMQVTGTLAAQYSGAGSSRGGAISLISSAGTPQDWIMATAGNDNSVVNGRSWFLYDNTNSVARFFVDTNGNVGAGLGSNAAAARLHLISTSTPQIRFGQSTSIYCDASIAATTGVVTFDSVGGSTPSFVFSDAVSINGSLTLSAQNIITDTTTGMKVGTGTTQKLGFWNATPIVQPTTAVAAATFVANTSGIVNDTATFDGYTMGQIVKALRNAGLLA